MPANEIKFYSLLKKEYQLINVTRYQNKNISYLSDQLIIAEVEYKKLSESQKKLLNEREVKLLVDDRPGKNALRFRYFK
jgi:hypothetical protein